MITYTYTRNDPAEALEFFKSKMAFSTGPIELNRAIDQKQDLIVVDVRQSAARQLGPTDWPAKGQAERALLLQPRLPPRRRGRPPARPAGIPGHGNGWRLALLDQAQAAHRAVSGQLLQVAGNGPIRQILNTRNQ
jgi:hypothetical protein